jgi:hypothetical protein
MPLAVVLPASKSACMHAFMHACSCLSPARPNKTTTLVLAAQQWRPTSQDCGTPRLAHMYISLRYCALHLHRPQQLVSTCQARAYRAIPSRLRLLAPPVVKLCHYAEPCPTTFTSTSTHFPSNRVQRNAPLPPAQIGTGNGPLRLTPFSAVNAFIRRDEPIRIFLSRCTVACQLDAGIYTEHNSRACLRARWKRS